MIEAFTEDEWKLALSMREAEIRVVDGKLTIHFSMSNEYAAMVLHEMMRPGGPPKAAPYLTQPLRGRVKCR